MDKPVKIYSSTEPIVQDDLKIGILKLKVISQWDFRSKTICFMEYNKTGGTITIPYLLERCIYISEDKKTTKWIIVKTITSSIRFSLLAGGYILSDN